MDLLPEGVTFNKNLTYLAKTNFRNQEQVFGIKRRDRRQHIYVLGKSGTGKSTLLSSMIVQNIWNGEGVCVIDPHGELVESILATIPPHRAKDVIYFNPADMDYHIGFNVLQIDDQRYKHLVASGLMGIFTKIWANAWSARMEYILNNSILALLDTPGSTLLGIPRLLVDKDFRQTIIGNLKDPVIKAFWVHEFEAWREQYRNEAIAPIQNKVGQFLSSSIVRNVVGQAKSTIDLFEIMNSGKIFLVNVSKGRIGEDNSALLGGMLITKIQLAAMERVRIPEDERKDFYLYVDEFQNFVTDSFASILSEARKYRLNLTLAHQYIAQLSTKDSDTVRDAIFGNVGTMIVFRVGAVDGEYLEKEFDPEFTTQDMVNLPNFKIYLKLMVDGVTSRPFSASTLPAFRIPEDSHVKEEIIQSSRDLYARPKDVIEREIFEWSGMQSGGSNSSDEGKFKAVCSSCGKETTVPFEPEAGRPVYCKDCIAKIKTGDLKPLKGTRSKVLEPQSFAPLSDLGIEFPSENKSSSRPVVRREQTISVSKPAVVVAKIPQPQTKVSPTISSQEVKSPQAVNTTTVIPVVLDTDILPQIDRTKNFREPTSFRKTRPERQKVEHTGLKDILKQALGEAIDKSSEFKKEINDKETEKKSETPKVQKTISLVSLKKNENNISNQNGKISFSKIASEEHLSALQEAIARAKIPVQNMNKENVAPEEDSSKNKEEDIATVASSNVTEDSGAKKIKEIPEDVLRGVLE